MWIGGLVFECFSSHYLFITRLFDIILQIPDIDHENF